MPSYPGKNIPTAPPRRRKIDLRSLSFGLGGPEQPYPVYQFSGYRCKLEYPRHNPFEDKSALLNESGGALLTEGGAGIDFG